MRGLHPCRSGERARLEKVELGVELSDGMHMAVACAAAAIDAGAVMVKTATSPMGVPLTQDFASYMEIKGDAKGLRCGLRTTELGRAAGQLQWLLQTEKSSGSPFDSGVAENDASLCLSAGDDIDQVVKVIRAMGYELSEEDNAKVFESFQRIAEKKHFVGSRELEAIIASTALQVPSTYRIADYVVTAGGTIGAMAQYHPGEGRQAPGRRLRRGRPHRRGLPGHRADHRPPL